MIDRSVFVGLAVSAISWLAGYFLTLVLSDGLSGSAAYALVGGWWFTAYTAAIFAVPLSAALPLGGIYFLVFVVSAITGTSWLYHDVASLPLLAVFGIGLLQSFFVASPILFNNFFGFCVGFLPNWVQRKID